MELQDKLIDYLTNLSDNLSNSTDPKTFLEREHDTSQRSIITQLIEDILRGNISQMFDDFYMLPSLANAQAPVAASANPILGVIETASGQRIRRAFFRDGAVFLYGPTASGKTFWAKTLGETATDHVEIVVFKPGLRDDNLYGSVVQDSSSGDSRWVWRDGPLVRGARLVQQGKTCTFIFDELARADKTIVAGIMDILNRYTRRDIEALGLSPLGDGDSFHILRIHDTQETFVLPTDKVKIMATANIGDAYLGLDLTDPAFRRRWEGGFIELAEMTPEEKRQILGSQLPQSSDRIISHILLAEEAISRYQQKEFALVMNLNISLMTLWGRDIVTRQKEGLPYVKAFVEAAQDIWVDMVCPVRGERKDAEVEKEVLTILNQVVSGKSKEQSAA